MQNLKRRGRRVKLNKIKLEPKKGKNYAEVLFIGDWHLGHPECLLDKIKEQLDYCLEKKIYIHLMGDLVECGITGSVGDSVYKQLLDPQEQMEAVVEALTPLAKAGLITGLHGGNHEQRILNTTGIDVAKIMAGQLDVPYIEMACWNLFYVADQSYLAYTLHGSAGSRFLYTKLKSATDISHYFQSDILVHAHVHDMASYVVERQRIDKGKKEIVYYKQHILLSGHYLGYQSSYAQAKGFPPSKVGSPKVKFFTNEHDIHISI